MDQQQPSLNESEQTTASSSTVNTSPSSSTANTMPQTPEEKIKVAQQLKEEGNVFFKQQQYKKALSKYKYVCRCKIVLFTMVL